MPYKIKKQRCKQSDGDTGSYVVQKKKSGKWKKSSCHTSKQKAKSATRARYASEKGKNEAANLIRSFVRSVILESQREKRTSHLPDFFYSPLEKALIESEFWTYENTPEDMDMNSIAGEWHDQTPSAEVLGKAIESFLASQGVSLSVAVRVADPDTNPNLKIPISSGHKLYPNRLVVGGSQGVTPKGRFIMYLNMVPVSDDFNSEDVSPKMVSRIVANIVRHEYIHARQIEKRRKNQRITRVSAKDRYEGEGEIPDSENRSQYLQSNIEIDAYAHEFAEDLLQKYGKKKSLQILRGSLPDSDVELSDQFQEYLDDLSGTRALFKLKKKMYDHIISLTDRGIYEGSRGSHPDESYKKGNRKNLHLDKPTSHGGWPEGEYDPPVEDQIYNWLKSMKMVEGK